MGYSPWGSKESDATERPHSILDDVDLPTPLKLG